MDQDHPDQDLKARVERLERQVEVLRKELKTRVSHGEREPRGPERASGPTPSATVPPFESAFEPRPHASPRPPPKGFSARDILENAEVWLPRVGIGLVLLAVAFAFKYSIDQGWVIPAVRVASGYVLGLALLVAGFKLSDSRPGYVQALFGGAIATFYITGFSAFQLYGLFSYPFAFGLMVAATMLAFFLSLQLDRAALSVIGVMGGLGTPFLLYTGSGNVPGLIAYTTLVLAGASAVYFHRGWRPLLQVAVVGGWLVLAIAVGASSSSVFLDAASVQVGIVVAWLSFWAIPLAREVVSGEGVNATPTDEPEESLRRDVHLLSVATPLIALALTSWAWRLSTVEAGVVALGLTVVYALAARMVVERPGVRDLGHTQGLVALMLSTLALSLLLDGEALLVALAAQALVVHEVARRISDSWTEAWGHVLSGIVGLYLGARLLAPASGTPMLNVGALADLGAITAAFLACRLVGKQKVYYYLTGHAAVLALIWREFVPLSGGHAYVSFLWAAYAITLLVVGLRNARQVMWQTGVATLLLLVGKLFVVDLANLDAIWRILLFMVVGGGFLALGYAFPNLRRPGAEADAG